MLLAPHDARVLVGCGVREAVDLAGLAADDSPEVGALAVLAPLHSARVGPSALSCGTAPRTPAASRRPRRIGGYEAHLGLQDPRGNGDRSRAAAPAAPAPAHLVGVVALRALGLENLGALLDVARVHGDIRLGDAHGGACVLDARGLGAPHEGDSAELGT